jgi:uncharacterized protein YdcH (DUF465 family)
MRKSRWDRETVPLEVGTMKQGVSSGGLLAHGERERLSLAEARHRELDQRLRDLGRHAYLTPSEQVEVSEIKKQKLRAKDEIVALRRIL